MNSYAEVRVKNVMPPKKKEEKKTKNIFLELKDKNKPKNNKTRSFTFLYFILAFIILAIINNYVMRPEVKTITYHHLPDAPPCIPLYLRVSAGDGPHGERNECSRVP